MKTTSRRRTAARRAVAAAGAAGLLAIPAIAGAHAAPRAHAAGATTVETVKLSSIGHVLAASNGHVLYMFNKDKKGKSTCTGSCTKVWKPYKASGSVIAKSGSGLNAHLLGTIKSTHQVTYNGKPLYTYTKDKKAGQSNGQALQSFGGDWYLIGTKGKAITCQPGVQCTY
jgi:predicted lipoprotein with Yx(FWY)xxD motif